MSKPQTIKIDDVKYVRADDVETIAPNGNRAVVVVDRGWIFAGDLEHVDRTDGEFIILNRAVWVFKWSSIGFDGVIADPFDENVTLKKLKNPVEIPVASEIFRIPVSANWGLK